MADPVGVALFLCAACKDTFTKTGTLPVTRLSSGDAVCEHRRPRSLAEDLYFGARP